MSMTAEHVAQEDLMALADGELSGAELAAAEQHVAGCAVCAAGLAQARQPMAAWTVEAAPVAIDAAVLERLSEWRDGKQVVARSPKRWGWGLGAGAGALALLALSVVVVRPPAQKQTSLTPENRMELQNSAHEPKREAMADEKQAPAAAMETELVAPPPLPPPPSMAVVQSNVDRSARSIAVGGRHSSAALQPLAAPMIARTVALAMTVKDVDRARESLDGLLRAYNGYAAQMEVQTPDGGTRTLHASLRVPAEQMRGLLAELKGYGKMTSETQTGEEVGQQHADLVARLGNARQSELRLRDILKTRPGDVADVLQVEEEIARVRGEIEGMEAEQQGLEHRVTYATIELDLSEHDPTPVATAGAWSRLADAARMGGRNAVGFVVGLIAFVLEYGLAIVLFVALLIVPAWLLWRRWRKANARW